jgi:hypothetical protein
MERFLLPRRVLQETFQHFRTCGEGRNECQVLWTSSWHSPFAIDAAIHPKHTGHFGGFVLEDRWLNSFWLDLARESRGVRIQVHTHPREAFHSETDDNFPIVHTPGFLSLVIPDFGLTQPSFDRAYLARLDEKGKWNKVRIADHLEVIDHVEAQFLA